MKRPVTIIFLGAIIVVLSVIQVIVASSISTTGTLLAQVEEKSDRLDSENTKLREKLLSASSLYQIASSAAALGFVETKSQIFISKPVPLALKR